MAYLEDLNNLATILLQEYTNKNLVPEWFSINMKTLLSKNITLEDWNNVQWYLKNVAAENEAVFNFCQNLNNALTNFEGNVDAAISQAVRNAQSYTDNRVDEQATRLTQVATLLDTQITNVDIKHTSLSQNIVSNFNARIDEIDSTHTNTVAGLIDDFNNRIQDIDNSITGVRMTLQNEYPHLESGKIPSNYLPSYVDDVVEVPGIALQTTGEFGKIYVDVNTNKVYRWSGTRMVEIISSGGSGGSGENADLSNYYTKDQTNAAIQSALNAIGVAEGGAY